MTVHTGCSGQRVKAPWLGTMASPVSSGMFLSRSIFEAFFTRFAEHQVFQGLYFSNPLDLLPCAG
jgi:hypothetical protein